MQLEKCATQMKYISASISWFYCTLTGQSKVKRTLFTYYLLPREHLLLRQPHWLQNSLPYHLLMVLVLVQMQQEQPLYWSHSPLYQLRTIQEHLTKHSDTIHFNILYYIHIKYNQTHNDTKETNKPKNEFFKQSKKKKQHPIHNNPSTYHLS